MAEQESRLAIRLDSSGAEKQAESLVDALVKMTRAGQQAEQATDSLRHEFIDYNIVQKSASKEARNHRQELSEQQKALAKLRDQIDPVSAALDKLDDRYQELKKYQKAGILPDDDFDYLASKIRNTEKAINGEALAERAAAKARDEQSASLQRLSAQLDPIGTAFKKLADQQKQLDSAKASGMLSPERYDVLSSSLANTRKQLEITQDAMKKTGVTSRAVAYQMRMIPAQMTDIVVSLASGQAPLTVLLQQGGQLKDMFGGIAPAIKGVTTYVMGLVNPYSVAAAAVGLLTYAVYQNRQEIDAATKIATMSLGANGDAAERLALNMVAISDKTGQAIDEVGNMFITTNDGAAEAINKLIDVGYSYDEARQKVAQYKGAANFTALNSDIDQHRREILKIGDSWTAAAIKVKNYYTAADKGRQNVALGGAIDPSMRFIGQAIDLQNTLNTLTIQGNKAVAESVDWINKEYLAADSVAGAEARLKEARAQSRNITFSGNKEAIAQANALIAVREKELEQAKKGQQPKTPKTPKGKAYTEDAATRLLDQLNRQHEVMQQQLNTTEKIGTAEQALVKWKSQLSEIQKKGILTSEQKSLLANQASITAQYEKNAALEKEIALRKDADKLTAYKNTLSSGLQNDAIGLQNSLNSNTVLSQEHKRQQELTKIASDYQKKQVELTNQRTTGQISQSLFDEETVALQLALNQRLAMQQAYYSHLDQLNGNWQLGVQNGLQSYLNSVPTLYESVTSAATSILSSTESAISSNLSAMIQGTESLSDGFKNMASGMGQAVIDALTKMATQWLVYQAVQLLVGKTAAAGAQASMIGQATAMSQIAAINAYASAAAVPITGWALAPAAMAAAEAATAPLIAAVSASSAMMTAGAGFASGGYTGPGGKYQPAGIVHKGEYVFDQASTNRIGVTQLEALRNGKPLDATLSKPGFGTGVQNVNSDNSRKTTIHAPIEQHFHSPAGVTPDQMAISMAQTQKRATTEAINQVAAQVIKGDGKVGNAMRSKYPGRGMS